MKFDSSPAADGYVLTADYDHKATLMLFPFRRDVWNDVDKAQKMHIEFIKKLSRYERVYVGVRDSERKKVEAVENDNIVVLTLPQDDAWIRDTGPLFVKKGGDVRMVKNGFNAWGGLYDDWSNDVKITAELSSIFDRGYYENDFILEGGNITTDGKGTAILVKNCIINPNRNSCTENEMEAALKSGLGLKNIIWLKDGFVNDETDGHIDNVCRFLPNGEVVVTWTDDKAHPMYDRCREIEKALKAQASYLVVNKIVTPAAQYRMPDEVVDCNGAKKRLSEELLTASYINYYATDKAVFIPQFGVAEDETAVRQFKALFENREIVPLNAREYILAGGCLHCLTLGVDF